jgi:long-chain acyl-CoA synthetase
MRSGTGYEVRQIKHLKDMIEQSAELFGDKDAFRVKTPEGTVKGITYKTFKNDVNALGTAFLLMGLKNAFIAVIGENRYEWCVTYLAAANGTGVIVPLDKELPSPEVENLLSRSGTSAIVYSAKYENEIQKMVQRLPNLKYLINMDVVENREDCLSFHQLLKTGQAQINQGDRTFLDAAIDPDVMSMLLFTSGTTDLAKGVMLSHRNLCSNITSVCSTVRITSSDYTLSILPLHHTYECTLGFQAVIYNGGTISFCEGLKHIAKNMKETRPTLLFTVPLLLESMHKKIWEQASKKRLGKGILRLALGISEFLHQLLHIDIRRKVFRRIHDNIGGNLRLIMTGAAAIDPKVSKFFRKIGIMVLQGYGLTECSPLAAGNRDDLYNDSSIGLPIPGVEMKLDNPNEEGIGEILVKGPNVMLGYYKNETATQKVMKNGWFHTGDLARRDKTGFYYITGREKNVIVTKNGKNIYPEEVESYLNNSLYVQESLVWGEYDENSGETFVNAHIVPNLNAIREKLKIAETSRDEIFKLMKEEITKINHNMPLYKRIREFDIREQEFVKTTTKKIKRYLEAGMQRQEKH